MRFGVNYTPRHGWFHSWLDYDSAQIRDDLQAIAALGADHVRIFPLWTLLQPNRNLIRSRALDEVAQTVRIAGECGLDVWIDVLQGHLSSFDFLPSWLITWHQRNLFTDPEVVEAQTRLIEAMAEALRDIPAAQGLSLGNEFIQFAASRHPFQCLVTATEAEEWLKTLFTQLEKSWPEGLHAHNFDDDLWFEPSQAFTPEMATKWGSYTTVHSWVFGRVGPRYGVDASELSWFARYLCELAAGWDPGGTRAVWLQEVGSPRNYISCQHSEQFVADTLQHLLGDPLRGFTGATNLKQITWWCSHDVESSLADFPYFEHSLGLIDQDGNLKPEGETLRNTIKQWKIFESSARPFSSKSSPLPSDSETMSIAVTPSTRNLTDAGHDFFARWVRRAMQGKTCRISINTGEGDAGVRR